MVKALYRLMKIGDPLISLSEHVDFVALAASIDTASPRPWRAKGDRPPYSTTLMIKILVLQQLYNQADDALEYQLLDRRSFLQFLGLTDSSTIPEAKRSGYSAIACRPSVVYACPGRETLFLIMLAITLFSILEMARRLWFDE